VIVLKGHYSQEEVVAFYRLADVMVINSLHDGMNLVAKEYVASRPDGEGALLLSPFTGAARELTWAYSVNPYNPEEIADAIFQALEDPPRAQGGTSGRHALLGPGTQHLSMVGAFSPGPGSPSQGRLTDRRLPVRIQGARFYPAPKIGITF
jgi:hypothetical protein